MKVVVLANYPTYRFGKELGISLGDEKRVTSWNETLIYALTKLNGVEAHVITLCKAKQTTVVRKGALTVNFLVVPKLMNAVTLYTYTALKAIQIIKSIRPDIVHGIGTEHIWPTAALMSKYPAVLTVHGIMNNIVKKLNLPLLSRMRWFSLLERRVLHRAKHLITISPYVMVSLGQFSKAKTFSIENPIAIRFFNATAQPANSKKILFIGDTGQRKSLLTILEAFVKLKKTGYAEGWQIVVIGPIINGPYHDKIMALIREQEIEDQIVFKGFILPDALVEEYQTSALLALSSIEETAPMCIAEAMAVGLPVVATCVSGVPYMVSAGETGFLCTVGDSEEMAARMLDLIESPGLRERLGRKAKKEAEQRWRPEKIALQTLQVYQDVLKGQSL